MKKTLVATLVAFLAGGIFAAALDHWEFDSETKTISDGVWTFNASLSGSNITIDKVTDDGYPTEISPVDFSMKVVKKGEPKTEYIITTINALFWYYSGGHKYKAGGEYVGKFTLPGEGLVTMGGDGISIASTNTSHACGDIVVPSTVTSIGRNWFQRTKITSITFEPGNDTTINSEMCSGCPALTSVVFKAGGTYKFLTECRAFSSCNALKNVDLSGVVWAGGRSSRGIVSGCGELTNIVLNSNLFLTNSSSTAESIWYALFQNNNKLKTIRFTGAAPDELEKWVTGDNRYIDCLGSSLDIATIVPAQYRNTKNASGNSWAKYSESGRLNTCDSTWASEYVTAGIDLSKRKLIMDREPEDDPPVVGDPTVTGVWAYQATVTANGSGIRGGEVFVSLTNALGEVTGPMVADDFGKSRTFTNLTCGTAYAVLVVATNAYGTVTNATASFTTLAKQADVSVAKGGDADFNRSQSGSFVISRADDDATDYPLTVRYAIGGTAVAGTDYTALPATVTIPVDEKSVVIPVVPLYCETQVAGDTAVTLTLADDPGYAVGTRTESVGIKKVEAVHYSIAAGTNPTGSTRGTFIVSRGANDPIDQKVTLTYTISGAGANAIFPLSGTVVIPPYATSATIEIFGNNASGSDASLTVTIDAGAYTLLVPSATITVTAGAQSERWLVDTSEKTMSWGGWKFGGVDTSNRKITMGNGSLRESPATTSPLDFSLPVVDADGNRYVIGQISARGALSAQKAAIGELTLPGEGMTGIDYSAFSGCANMTGTLVFPTSCSSIGGESFNNCTKIKILGSSITGWVTMPGKDTLNNVSFDGEALALSLVEVKDGGFYNSKVESIRFGPGLKTLGRYDGRNGFFQNCASLTNVVFDPVSRVSLEYGITFSGCKALESIDLTPVTNITVGAFGTKNNNGTFYNCSALTNVIFGADLHYLASNVFAEAFDKSAPARSITFEGLPPEHFEMPYLSKVPGNGSKGYPTIATYVHSKYLSKTNAAGKCWLDYAAGGVINRKNSTWASEFLPSEITDLTRRPLLTIEPPGLIIIVR